MQSLTRPWGTMHVEAEDRHGDWPFVFLNSLGTDLRMWDLALRRLPSAGRAIRMDFRGHGLSATSDRAYGNADLVDDVLAAWGLASALPDATFHEFSGAGHLPAIEQPEAFAERLSDFIEGQCNE